jgi:hypothetical protein
MNINTASIEILKRALNCLCLHFFRRSWNQSSATPCIDPFSKMGKVRSEDPAKLTDFKLLSFDVYSTLVDEHGALTNYHSNSVFHLQGLRGSQ